MATPPLQLFYWPTSSASQKALMALEEKNLKYKKTVVNISEGEQHEAWYLRVNAAGQVPVLKIDSDFVPDSEAIFDAINGLDSDHTLVPDPITPEGRLVQHWRKRFSTEIDMYLLTFGTIINPQLADGKLEIPPLYQLNHEKLKARTVNTVKKLESVKVKNPDLAEAVDKKIATMKAMGDPSNLEAKKVEEARDALQKMFDDIEKQLCKSRQENIVEHWLCGPNFTACDITLIMLLGRLKFLTYFPRFVNPEQRPALVEYWAQACRRPCVQKVVLGAKSNMAKYMIERTARRLALGSVAALGAATLVFFSLKKFRS